MASISTAVTQASPPDHVQVVMVTSPSGSKTPGIVARPVMVNGPLSHGQCGHTSSAPSTPIPATNTSPMGPYYATPMAPRKRQVDKWWKFNPLCKAEFAGGNGIYFGIRSAASESIETYLQKTIELVSAPDRDYKSHRFIEAPRTETRWGNTWTWFSAYLPSPVGDGMEIWMTPIGDSGYYVRVHMNFIEAARQKTPKTTNAPAN